MANGDDAVAAGLGKVYSTDKVRQGYDEINKTRDQVAQTRAQIPASKAAYRAAAGITVSTSSPSGGADGDIWFKIV